jgi:hypothetical protein
MRKLNVPPDVPRKTLIVHEGPSESASFGRSFHDKPIFMIQLMEPPRCAQPGRAGADDDKFKMLH